MDSGILHVARPSAWQHIFRPGLAAAVAMTLTGCSLDVDNPTDIEDDDLYDQNAVDALVAGAAGDFAEAMVDPGGGGLYMAGAVLTDEMVHVGTWVGLRGLSDGLSSDEWAESQTRWSQASQARWVAEQGIQRISGILEEAGRDPATSPAIAQITLWAGHADRALGDSFCHAVIDGQGMEDHTAFYTRAIGHFTDAIAIAEQTGDDDLRLSALGGRAHVHMMLGDWDAALADAGAIPTDFTFLQFHEENGAEDNQLYWWAYDRNETSVWGTPFAEWGQQYDQEGAAVGSGDPRVPFDIAREDDGSVRAGGDGRRPFYRALKYDSYGDDIAVVKGTEMRLLEAEAALLGHAPGGIQGMVAKINEVRAFHGLAPIDPATVATTADAWALLQKERGIELWLEGKRLPDFRRWAVTPGTVYTQVVRAAIMSEPPSADPVLPALDTDVMDEVDDICLKISRDEKNVNPNL